MTFLLHPLGLDVVPLVHRLGQRGGVRQLSSGRDSSGGVLGTDLGGRLIHGTGPGEGIRIAGHHLRELRGALVDDLDREGLVLGFRVERELVGGLACKKKMTMST